MNKKGIRIEDLTAGFQQAGEELVELPDLPLGPTSEFWRIKDDPLVFGAAAGLALDEQPADAAPGTVVRVAADGLCVATGEGLLALTRVQAPGKRPMDVSDFLRGHRIAPGERFEELPPA